MAQQLQICNVQLRLSQGFLDIVVQAQPFSGGIKSLLVNPLLVFLVCVSLNWGFISVMKSQLLGMLQITAGHHRDTGHLQGRIWALAWEGLRSSHQGHSPRHW